MTISQYVDVARRPNRYETDELWDAAKFWNKRAFVTDGHVQTVAMIWRRMCVEALNERAARRSTEG